MIATETSLEVKKQNITWVWNLCPLKIECLKWVSCQYSEEQVDNMCFLTS